MAVERPIESNSDPRCSCHKVPINKTSRKALIKLVIACIIALIFVIGEIIGGYFSNSLAILTDAAHMLSDFGSFLISLFSVWMASRPPSKKMSFGWYRAEVIGAIVSVLIIWLMTGILCYEAVMRIIKKDSKIDADIMLITACGGVFVNVFMCMVLHQHNHGHAHSNLNSRQVDNSSCDCAASCFTCQHEANVSPPKKRWWQRRETISNRDIEANGSRRRKNKDSRNINIRAAFIHVIGDLIQSIGVLIAGYIIKFWPRLQIVDPLCTFLFSIIVILTTLNVLRDAVLVIMEGVPGHIKTDQVKMDLMSLRNVKHAHSIHVWSLTTSKAALAAHLAVESQMHSQDVLEGAGEMLKSKYGFAHTTLQVEKYQDEMRSCGPCQGTISTTN